VEVNDDDGRREATRLLFEACRKSVDGIVSRHLNRHVSLTLSRWLVDTPVTPNAMTIATFAVGLVATWLVLDASYATTAAAGVLMQLNSILDGCDGELARVRHQGSKLGQWLDTVGDDLSNVLFWTALGFGARAIDPEGVWMAPAAWITAAGNGLAALINYGLLARKGSGDFYALREDEPADASAFTKVASFLANTVLKQDFFLLFVMLVALAGVLHWVTPLLALAAVVTLGGAVARVWRAR
jgi:phosphatidylglycerophosphate synthase